MPLFAQMGKEPQVWDPKRNRLAAVFNDDGVFNTEDKDTAALLRRLHYREVKPEEVTALGLEIPEPGIVEKQPLSPGAGYQKVITSDGDQEHAANDGGFDQPVVPRRSLR